MSCPVWNVQSSAILDIPDSHNLSMEVGLSRTGLMRLPVRCALLHKSMVSLDVCSTHTRAVVSVQCVTCTATVLPSFALDSTLMTNWHNIIQFVHIYDNRWNVT